MDFKSKLQLTVSEVQAQVPVTVFHVEGRVNLSNADELEQLARRQHRDGMRFLLLDLAGVPSLSSAGLRAIHAIYNLLEGPTQVDASQPAVGREQGSRSPHLKLHVPHPQVRTVLKIAGFDSYIDVFEQYQAAIDSFQEAA